MVDKMSVKCLLILSVEMINGKSAKMAGIMHEVDHAYSIWSFNNVFQGAFWTVCSMIKMKLKLKLILLQFASFFSSQRAKTDKVLHKKQ